MNYLFSPLSLGCSVPNNCGICAPCKNKNLKKKCVQRRCLALLAEPSPRGKVRLDFHVALLFCCIVTFVFSFCCSYCCLQLDRTTFPCPLLCSLCQATYFKGYLTTYVFLHLAPGRALRRRFHRLAIDVFPIGFLPRRLQFQRIVVHACDGRFNAHFRDQNPRDSTRTA